MIDMMKDKLICLAASQEVMNHVSDKLTQWDESQLIMENSAFEALNLSDEILNMSGKGNALIDRLFDCSLVGSKEADNINRQNMTTLLGEIRDLFIKINQTSIYINEISHKVEGQAETQGEIQEAIKEKLKELGQCMEAVSACAEFFLADI